MKLLSLILFSLALPVHAGAPDAATRPPTEAEIASFATYYQGAFGSAPQATLIATRVGRNWRVTASADGPLRRGVAPLCRMARTSFVYDAGKRTWIAPGAAEQLAWLSGGTCSVPARPVVQVQQVPDVDLIPLLEQQGQLLLQARLLMSGNSSCAVMRSYRFHLHGVNVSAPPGGSEELVELMYDSDRDTHASLWLKKIKGVLTVWNVSCR